MQKTSPADYGPRRHLARLFGVSLVSDIHERLCGLGLPVPIDAKRADRLARIRAAGLLFVHVPKNGGMAASAALYGMQIRHASARWYARADATLLNEVPSFALVRDPVSRFASAYRYGRAGGSRDNRVSAPFRDTYRGFGSIDDALDHLEQARSPFAVDHIFRPQSWYVTGPGGAVLVDRLVTFEAMHRLPDIFPQFPRRPIARLNAAAGDVPDLSARQIERLRRLYARDFALHDMARRAPVMQARRAPPGRAPGGAQAAVA